MWLSDRFPRCPAIPVYPTPPFLGPRQPPLGFLAMPIAPSEPSTRPEFYTASRTDVRTRHILLLLSCVFGLRALSSLGVYTGTQIDMAVTRREHRRPMPWTGTSRHAGLPRLRPGMLDGMSALQSR